MVCHPKDSDSNLVVSEQRRSWLQTQYNLKETHLLTIEEVRKTGGSLLRGKLIVLFGKEFDRQGHEGELELSGAAGYLEMYAGVIRKLSDSGYSRIFVTTDHGYFHYIPQDDEVVSKPEGELYWKSRRAIVGKHLTHPTAVKTLIPKGDAECMTPRSVNAFQTYGRIGFFHGGITLPGMCDSGGQCAMGQKSRKDWGC